MFLVDTDVLSLLRRPERSPGVSRWMAGQRTADLYVSVVSVAEIERGITRQRGRDPAFARALAAWLDSVLSLYGDRILPVDASTARRWGRLSGDLGHEGTDLLIAATALEHGLTVVTRQRSALRTDRRVMPGSVRHRFRHPCRAEPVRGAHGTPASSWSQARPTAAPARSTRQGESR